jgi:hypothetical protein
MANDGHHQQVHREITHPQAAAGAAHKDLINHVQDAHAAHPIAHPASHPAEHKVEVKATPAPAHPVAKPAQTAFAREFNKGYGDCHGQWAQTVNGWITDNEAKQHKQLTYLPNDAGHGISVGLLQWNQKRGSLNTLLSDWHHQDPAKFDRYFGKYSGALMDVKNVHKADFNNNPILHNGMIAALKDPEFQRVQFSLREQQLAKSCVLADEHGFKSIRGRGYTADLYTNIGPGATARALAKIPPNHNESLRIEQLKAVTAYRPHAGIRDGNIEEAAKVVWRKLAQGNPG